MTTKNNILILSAGRRVELVKAFQTEAAQFSDGIKVFCTDLNPKMSPACQVADGAFIVPQISSEEYIDSIFDLALEQNIGLIIPTIDTELYKLAQARTRFEAAGIHIVVANTELITKLRDKRDTIAVFEQFGIQSPKIYARDAIEFPCFAKPYDGSRGIGVQAVMSKEDLTEELLSNPKMMFCQLIDIQHTFKEFTVDMYYDREGRLKCVVPRERLEVRSGEVSKGATRRDWLYDTLWEKMPEFKGARGCMTAQFFYNSNTHELYGVEINPRFGGGFPLTYDAGANYPAWLIREYFKDETIEKFEDWETNLIMLRYDAAVLIRE